jgi:hypothetical protein
MDTQIGEAAGRIWHYLAEHGETTVRQLQRGTTLPERLVLMGVGWLAREDKLCLVQEPALLRCRRIDFEIPKQFCGGDMG